MKVAAIFHSILVIIFSFLLMFICDIPIISKASHAFFSDEAITTIQKSLLEEYRIYSTEISAFAVIEGTILVASIILVIIALVNGVKKIVEMFKTVTEIEYETVDGKNLH